MFKRNSPDKKKKKRKKEASIGCVKEIPYLKMKPAWDV